MAPSPMESMAMTAATPKMMPSMVRKVRSLWEVSPEILRPKVSWRSTLTLPR